MSKHSTGDDDDIIAAAREGFLEEAQDNLRQFEQGLLAMEQDPGDAEAVNSAFRAAHTIKGGAGLFGFQAVVGFTHEVESVLDRMRDGTEGNAELEAISQRLGEQLRQLRRRISKPRQQLSGSSSSSSGTASVSVRMPSTSPSVSR